MRTVVIGATGGGAHARYCTAFTQALRSLEVEVVAAGYAGLPTPSYVRWPLARQSDRLVRLALHARRLRKEVRASNPDLVHLQLVSPLVDRWWLPGIASKTPFVWTMHNIAPHEKSFLHARRHVEPIADAAAAIVVHSAANKSAVESIFPCVVGKVEVIPHGVWQDVRPEARHSARQALEIGDSKFVLLLFGALRRNKGFLALLDAVMGLPRATLARLVVIVAGAGTKELSEVDMLEAIRVRGLQSLVKFLPGFASPEQLARCFGAADLVVLPYDASFQAQSGVLFDAYASGVPLLVTNVGGVGETVSADGTGLVVADNDPTTLGRAIDDLVAAPHVVSMYRTAVESRRSEYSWRSVAELTLNLYGRVLGRRSRRN